MKITSNGFESLSSSISSAYQHSGFTTQMFHTPGGDDDEENDENGDGDDTGDDNPPEDDEVVHSPVVTKPGKPK